MVRAKSVALVSAALLLLGACTTISPAGPSSPASPVTSPSVVVSTAAATLEPSLGLPTEAPIATDDLVPTEPPVDQPTEPPVDEPTDPPVDEPTDPPAPKGANIAVTKFTVDDKNPLPGDDVDGEVTIKNTGDQASGGPLTVNLVVTPADNPEEYMLVNLVENDGLAAGAVLRVPATFSLPAPGNYAVAAIADGDNLIDETNEDDNQKIVLMDARSAPNLAFVESSFTIAPKGDGSGDYTAKFTFINNGLTVAEQPFTVRIFYYMDGGGEGDFASFDVPPVTLQPGESSDQQVDFAVQPGTYIAYALLDSNELVAETDETDNEARYDFTAPAPI